MRFAMIDSGWSRLGACFADFGDEVTCLDNDNVKIEALNSGAVPIYEPVALPPFVPGQRPPDGADRPTLSPRYRGEPTATEP